MKAQKAAGSKARSRFLRKCGAVISAAAGLAAILTAAAGGGSILAVDNPDAENVALTVETVVLDQAGDFTATVFLDELPDSGINALDFAIAYDPAVLSIDTVELLYDTGAEKAEMLVDPKFKGTVFTTEDVDGELRVRWATALVNRDYWLREEQAFFTLHGHLSNDSGPGSYSPLAIVPASRETSQGSGIINTVIYAGYLDEEGNSHMCETKLQSGAVWVVLDETGALMYGDINTDGEITAADAVLLYRVLAEQATLGAAAYANADCEFDGALTIADVSLMREVLMGDLDAKALGAH